MTEDDARDWLAERYDANLRAKVERFVELIREEAPRQNLVSAASLDAIWARHIVDSAQLLTYANGAASWVDVGTGAGFPGMVTAILSGAETILVEPRRRRVEFLRRVVYELDLGSRVSVEHARIETISIQAQVISARAVASIDGVLASSAHCSTKDTIWLLPKGRNAPMEVAEAGKSWHGTFHVEHSVTDPESMIVIASGIARR